MSLKPLLFLLLSFSTVTAQKVIRLYDGPAPGSESWNWEEKENVNNMFHNRVVYNVSNPTLTVFLPDSAIATGTSIIIAPGGAFHTLSIDSEGEAVAKWLVSKGIAAFVLKYRVVKSETDDPVKELMGKMGDFNKLDAENAPVVPLAMMDGLTAVKYVRTHAKEYQLAADRIGFMGFSAGGTVTMSVVYNAKEDNKPNFIAPFYTYVPAVIGAEIPKSKTPVFIVAASDDQLGLAPHSVGIYTKWQAVGQPAEVHIYEKGGHGFGMNKQNIPTDTWADRFEDWLKMHGFSTRPASFELKTDLESINYQKREIKRMQTDWANLEKYEADNLSLLLQSGRKNRVVFMGNSITEFWVNMSPDFFSKNNFVGRGISGQTTPQMVLRFRSDVIKLKPAVVVINAGINDIAENTGPYDQQVTMGNIISMAEMAKANNIKVVLASVHPAIEFPWNKGIKGISQKVIDLNVLIKEYASKNDITYLDYHSAMKNANNGMSPDMAEDGIHPTLAGYKVMEGLAQKAVAETLKKK